MIAGVPWLMFAVGAVLVVGGLRFGTIARIARLPLWFCALLVGVVLIAVWLLFSTQYTGMGIGI